MFSYDAPIWVVLVHAAFVVLESIATCFIAACSHRETLTSKARPRVRISMCDLDRDLQTNAHEEGRLKRSPIGPLHKTSLLYSTSVSRRSRAELRLWAATNRRATLHPPDTYSQSLF